MDERPELRGRACSKIREAHDGAVVVHAGDPNRLWIGGQTENVKGA